MTHLKLQVCPIHYHAIEQSKLVMWRNPTSSYREMKYPGLWSKLQIYTAKEMDTEKTKALGPVIQFTMLIP